MKKLWVVILYIIIVNGLFSQGLEIRHLTGDFYVYTTYKVLNGAPFPSNSMYLVTSEGVVMIDTPWDTSQTLPLLDSIYARHKMQVMMCISTHFHDDRTGGLDILKRKGIKTFSSYQTFQLCLEKNEKVPEYYFTGDTVFSIGGAIFETFYPGAGHTADNIIIWFPEHLVLYGGCFVKSTASGGLGNIADADTKSWEAAVKTVMEKYPDAKYVIPGHGEWNNPAGLNHTLNLLIEFNRKN